MKEIREILHSYQQAVKDGKKTALATVVKVEGSSYRRPGARMLITEDGQLTGAISGGCLEGDALRKALSAIVQQKNKLVTYDTTDEDDAKFGIQLGCNGIVRILFEPIMTTEENNPIAFLSALAETREEAALVTLFSLSGTTQPGTSLLYRCETLMNKLPVELADEIFKDTHAVFNKRSSAFIAYDHDNESFEAFIEFISPPIALIIAGAGNDAQPLSRIANLLGWQVTVADGRPAQATAARFPEADRILVAKPEKLLEQILIDEQTAFVLMTHNYNYDLALLAGLLATSARYIGTLGPKKKLIRMLEELDLANPHYTKRVYGPIGLDIGAETAEEIAVSIAAEIKAVFSRASGRFLKDKNAPIHLYELPD